MRRSSAMRSRGCAAPTAICRRDIAVQWSAPVPSDFHARFAARGRRYRYVLLRSPVRPSLETGLVGWVFDELALEPMREAARHLIGEHDFSSFRSSECQAKSPVKTLRSIAIEQRGRTGTSTSTPARSCTTWCATSWAACWRWAALAARRGGCSRCWPPAIATPRRRRLPPKAFISSARTTMPLCSCPTVHRRATGCPETHLAATHPHQDLRPLAGGRRGRGGRSRAPMRSASRCTPRARAM